MVGGTLQTRTCLMLAALLLLHAGCDKAQENRPAESAKAATAPPVAAPFRTDGELLSMDVTNMPLADYLQALEKVTGSQIVQQASLPTGKVSVRADSISLRKALSVALNDAPYDVQMHYANLHYQFPQTVVISSANAAARPAEAPDDMEQQHAMLAEPAVARAVPTVQESGSVQEPVSVQERTVQLLAAGPEERAEMIFLLDSDDDDDLAVITALFQQETLSNEDKVALLDTLETGERERVVGFVTPLLQDDSVDVALKAIDVLGSVGEESDAPLLRELAASATNEDVKQSAADAADMLE